MSLRSEVASLTADDDWPEFILAEFGADIELACSVLMRI